MKVVQTVKDTLVFKLGALYRLLNQSDWKCMTLIDKSCLKYSFIKIHFISWLNLGLDMIPTSCVISVFGGVCELLPACLQLLYDILCFPLWCTWLSSILFLLKINLLSNIFKFYKLFRNLWFFCVSLHLPVYDTLLLNDIKERKNIYHSKWCKPKNLFNNICERKNCTAFMRGKRSQSKCFKLLNNQFFSNLITVFV